MASGKNTQALRDILRQAELRLEKAVQALATKHVGGEIEEWNASHNALMEAQRALAENLGQPYAVGLDFPVQWDTGAPLPMLMQSDYKTALVFLLGGGLTGDGTSVQVVDAKSTYSVATVHFDYCVATQMGSPNDEVFHGHPLYGKGLEAYRPMRVENSDWIKELSKINSVHHCYDPKRWLDLNHYIFGFHDCTFECVARAYSVTTSNQSIRDAARTALNDICE
ncbi:MAG: hypothetical protein JJ919_17340 [Henriciella sp.]|nr:hypothetical protein [Henriciella sp.]